MTKADFIYWATYCVGKGLDYEQFKYSDTLYNMSDEERERVLYEVFKYVEEIEEEGRRWFKKQYSDYKMYHAL